MKTRSLASMALGAVVALGMTGCAAMTPQATTVQYSPSDGVNVALPDDAPVKVLNALLVAGDEEDASDANFIAALVNTSDADETVTVSWDGGSAAVEVPAGSTESLGANAEPLLVQNVSAPAGATFEMIFQSGETEAVAEQIQVFDGELEQFTDLVPTAEPTEDASSEDDATTDEGDDAETEG